MRTDVEQEGRRATAVPSVLTKLGSGTSEDIDIRAPRAGHVIVAVDDRSILSTVRSRDEGAIAARSREDDVVRFVSDEQSAHDARRAADLADAHAVGEMVHDPDLVVVSSGDGDRLEVDAARRRQISLGVDVEEVDVAVGCVRDEELQAIGRTGTLSKS